MPKLKTMNVLGIMRQLSTLCLSEMAEMLQKFTFESIQHFFVHIIAVHLERTILFLR